MVDFDLPDRAADVDRWIVQWVLSPAATLHHEATTLLAEGPALAAADPLLHHSILGAIATGSVTAGRIASRLGRQVFNLAPALGRLPGWGLDVGAFDAGAPVVVGRSGAEPPGPGSTCSAGRQEAFGTRSRWGGGNSTGSMRSCVNRYVESTIQEIGQEGGLGAGSA